MIIFNKKYSDGFKKISNKKCISPPSYGRIDCTCNEKQNGFPSRTCQNDGVKSSTIYSYLKKDSIQFGILWNIGIALSYDFLTELTNSYPPEIMFNPKSKLVISLNEAEDKITDLQKEIKIYRSALNIRD